MLLIVISIFNFVLGIEIIDAQPSKKQPNSSHLKKSHKGKRQNSLLFDSTLCKRMS